MPVRMTRRVRAVASLVHALPRHERRRRWLRAFATLLIAAVSMSCRAAPEAEQKFFASELRVMAGGRPAVSLSRPQQGDAAPQILSVEILPGRGMNVYQVRAFLPGKGTVNLFESPLLEPEAARMDGGPEDFNGNESFKVGGAILVPYANRIRGRLLPDGKTLETTVLGGKVNLPANWRGRRPEAEPHAMHGLILASRMDEVRTEADATHAGVIATLHAGDFNGHWLSKTDLEIRAVLRGHSFGFTVTARNAGGEPLPMGIGWHPYFAFPSGNREQARVHIPSRDRALVNNYDDVFPTGKVVPVKGTAYDFSAPGGAPLGKLFLDDCFLNLEKDARGQAVAEIIDPAARYGMRIAGESPEIRAFQVYAPVDKSFVALEPQFNLADPFGKVWPKDVNTGMVVLQPGQSVTYSIELELFVP